MPGAGPLPIRKQGVQSTRLHEGGVAAPGNIGPNALALTGELCGAVRRVWGPCIARRPQLILAPLNELRVMFRPAVQPFEWRAQTWPRMERTIGGVYFLLKEPVPESPLWWALLEERMNAVCDL